MTTPRSATPTPDRVPDMLTPDFNQKYFDRIFHAMKLGGKNILRRSGDKSQDGIEAKPDKTMVSRTDKIGERAIRRVVRTLGGTFRGEELEQETINSEPLEWIVDPLDGTSSQLNGQGYSTSGLALYREGAPFMSAICDPYKGIITISAMGKGTWKYRVDENMEIIPGTNPTRMHVGEGTDNPMIYIDALYNKKTTPRKLELQRLLLEEGNDFNIRAIGSNIGQQLAVAIGNGQITLTDAVGGFHDLAAGALAIQEAGGDMVDVLTWGPVTPETQVAVGGNHAILKKYKEVLQKAYAGYTGFR